MCTGGSPRAASASPERLRCDAQGLATFDALQGLAPEWEALWQRAEGTPFQSPAWLLPWWQHIGEGTLMAAALREVASGRLVGLATTYVYRHPASGVRHLFPIGIATTDRLDMLVEPGCEAAALAAFADHLQATRHAWDLLELPQLHEDAVLLRMHWPAAWRRDVQPAEPNPVLALPASPAHAVAKDLAYCRRRAEREGGLSVELAGAHGLLPTLDTLADLHARRWRERDRPGVLGERGVLAWHREAAPRLFAAGLLRLLSVRLAGQVVAVLYCVADGAHVRRRRWFNYIGGFDPAFARYSPGMLAIGAAIDLATAEGAAAFDFLRGAEAYKFRWGAVDQPMFTLRVR